MLFIKSQYDFGMIQINPKDIYVNYDDYSVVVTCYEDNEDNIPVTIVDSLPSKKTALLTLDWIFHKIEQQLATQNIVVDVNKCPFLHAKED